MKEFLEKNKSKIILILFFILFGVIFFNYNIVTTWDSSEYLGMAKVFGTKDMMSIWIGHRGPSFPLLLKIFQFLGNNKYSFLIMLYIFYVIMIYGIIKIYKKLKEINFLNEKALKILFTFLVVLLIVLNPIIFGYYHTILTEFVSITITVVMCSMCFNWLDFSWDEDKKKIILYGIVFSLLGIFLYHIKQSLIPIVLISVLITSLLSLIESWNLKNILVRLFTIIFIGIMLAISIIVWNNAMSDINVAEITKEKRIGNSIVKALVNLTEVYDENSIKDINLDDINLSKGNKEEIDKILSNTSKYKAFKIYKNPNDKYFVFFTKDKYSFSEQIVFYLKILATSPMDIIESYSKNYHKMIFRRKGYPIEFFEENYNIPIRIFSNKSNVVDVNVDYEEYIEDYKVDSITHNNISRIYGNFELSLVKGLTVFTKCNIYILLPLISVLFIIYLLFKKKMSDINKKIMQYIIILYTISFGIVMCYVALLCLIDRYMIPAFIPMYLGDILLLVLIIKNITTKLEKKYNKSK